MTVSMANIMIISSGELPEIHSYLRNFRAMFTFCDEETTRSIFCECMHACKRPLKNSMKCICNV